MFNVQAARRGGLSSTQSMIALAVAGTLLVVILIWRWAGGSPHDLAYVSGTIRVDQQPVAGVKVTFEPIGSMKNPYPGPASYGVTDEEGWYSLRLITDDSAGAVIGSHRVRISWTKEQEQKDPLDIYDFLEEEQILPEYNSATTLSFDVTPEGTEEANFDVQRKSED